MRIKKIYPTILIAADGDNCQNYTSLMEKADFHSVTLRDDASFPYPSIAELCSMPFDILLLPGGGDFSGDLYQTSQAPGQNISTSCAALDMIQSALLSTAILLHKPVIGICKGMQLINVYLGGTLIPDLPGNMHPASVTEDGSADRMHPIHTISQTDYLLRMGTKREKLGLPQQKIHQLLSTFTEVNSAHHQGIKQLGSHLLPLQYAPDRLPETIMHTSLPILGMQWHPERLETMTPDLMHKLVLTLLTIR